MHDETPRSGDTTATRRPMSRRYSGLVAAGAIALAVAGGIVGVPIAADAATAPIKASAVCVRDVTALRHAYDALPTTLHDDIAKARKGSTKTARQDADKKILAKAQSGGYGADVAAAAKDRKSLEGAVDAWRRLPSALNADLKGAHAATGDTRTQDLQTILSKAESGGYGERVKTAATKIKTRIERCEAPTAGSHGSSSSSTPAPSPTYVRGRLSGFAPVAKTVALRLGWRQVPRREPRC